MKFDHIGHTGNRKAVVTIVGVNCDFSQNIDSLSHILGNILEVPISVTVETLNLDADIKMAKSTPQGPPATPEQLENRTHRLDHTIRQLQREKDELERRGLVLGSRDFLTFSDQPLIGMTPIGGVAVLSDSRPVPFAVDSRSHSNCSGFSEEYMHNPRKSSADFHDPPRKLSGLRESPSRSRKTSSVTYREGSPNYAPKRRTSNPSRKSSHGLQRVTPPSSTQQRKHQRPSRRHLKHTPSRTPPSTNGYSRHSSKRPRPSPSYHMNSHRTHPHSSPPQLYNVPNLPQKRKRDSPSQPSQRKPSPQPQRFSQESQPPTKRKSSRSPQPPPKRKSRSPQPPQKRLSHSPQPLPSRSLEPRSSSKREGSASRVLIQASPSPNPSVMADGTPKPKKSNLKKPQPKKPILKVKKQKSALEADTTDSIIRELSENPPAVLNPFGEPLTDTDIQYAFDKVDRNQDGRITLKEFTQSLTSLQIEIDTDKLKKLFHELDADNSNFLDLNEFRQALQKVHPTNAEIWQKMLGASTLDLRPTNKDYSLDKIRETLQSKRQEWTDRINAMHSFAKYSVQPMTKKKFDSMMRPICEPLINQLSDRRSAVVRECCIVIAKIAMVRQKDLTRWAPRILERLFKTIQINVDIMAISALQAVKSIIRCVPDNSKQELLTQVVKATANEHMRVRNDAYEMIAYKIELTRIDSVKRTRKFWSAVIDALNKGMQDKDDTVRQAAYTGTCELYVLNPDRTTKSLLNNLKGSHLTRFHSVLSSFKTSRQIYE